jgi:hypothetical protein
MSCIKAACLLKYLVKKKMLPEELEGSEEGRTNLVEKREDGKQN